MSATLERDRVARDCTHPVAHHTHGTVGGYVNDRCRCQPCTTAHADNARQRRRLHYYGQALPKSVPNVGTRRRVDALACLGWSMRVLSTRLGWEPDRLSQIFTDGGGISPLNAQRIAGLYDELWQTRAPTTARYAWQSVGRTIAMAEARGYAPPLAWDDDTIDDPAAVPLHELADAGLGVELAPCGTSAAYRRHLRRGERACRACTNAETLRVSEKRTAA